MYGSNRGLLGRLGRSTGTQGLYYKDHDYKRLHGFRILGIDASIITLPNTEEMRTEFGARDVGNHTSQDFSSYARGTFECCYDVINNIAVSSMLATANCYEADLATPMVELLNGDDLLIFDRAYASYKFMASLTTKNKNYMSYEKKLCMTF